MFDSLLEKLSDALYDYQEVIRNTADECAKDDYNRLSKITEKLIATLKDNDSNGAKLLIYSFARQVSDSFSMQPSEFKILAKVITDVKKRLFEESI
jgi:hypothetical protein